MSEFVASNGARVSVDKSGNLWLSENGHGLGLIEDGDASILREFFRAEEDERLGRWRWPENPEYVVYRADDDARVLHEPSGQVWVITRRAVNGATYGGIQDWHRAARVFFDAHPDPLDMPDGIYMVNTTFHPYERLVQRRRGEWLHLYRGDAPQHETHTAEQVARIAAKEGRLTPLVQVPEPDTTGGAS